MEIKIKKLNPMAVIPQYAKKGDAGMDLTAVSKFYDEFGNFCYGTGIAIEIPSGYVGLLFPRSSICRKDLILSNSVGILDSGYRGEITFKFKHASKIYKMNEFNLYQIGERIGQILIIPYPEIEFKEVNELSLTERGEGGYGSTGR